MRRGWGLGLAGTVLVVVAGTCEGTVNNDDVILATTVRASLGAGRAEPNGPSFTSAVSDDGRYVAFLSRADNLDPADADTVNDVYVRDVLDGTVTLVSRATGMAGVKSNGDCLSPSISSSGQFVAFATTANNLDASDGDAISDVYIRDVWSGITTLVSRAAAKGNGPSTEPALSPDGNFVAFVSESNNLDPADGDFLADIYVRDVSGSTTTLISRATGVAGAKADADCGRPAVSLGGGVVAFSSIATNLHADDTDGIVDVFARSVGPATTVLVSRATGVSGVKANGGGSPTLDLSLSADGRFVAFAMGATTLDPDDPDTLEDVFVRDLQASTTTLVSRASGTLGTKGNNPSNRPRISGDGRRVAFDSSASNLVQGDRNLTSDVFLRDLVGGTTGRVSVRTFGAEAGGSSTAATISGNGRFVAFESFAPNLVDDDNNGEVDIFLRGPLE